MKSLRSLFVLAIMLVAFGATALAGIDPLTARQCARNMCAQMRECETYVPQPSPVLEKVDSPKKGNASNVNTKAKGETVQEDIADCRQQAYWAFEDCLFGGQQEGRTKPVDATSKGNVKKAKVVTPNK